MEKNRVSIVVAIYNSAQFLEKLINSIIDQTYKNLEIILVDDGSPDNSFEICKKFAAKDKRIVIIHKNNGGTCEARNVGIERAKGDYLMFVDGDDWLSRDCVEYLLKMAISTDSDMSLTDKIFTTRDQEQVKDDKMEIWSAEQAVASIIYPRFAIGPWNKLYKMTMIEKYHLRFNVPWSGEGLYFSSMAASYSNHVAVGHRKIYNYRLNNMGSGLTNYKVEIAQNALWNIYNIKRVITLRTPKVMHAIDWHIWKNYNFLLRLIIATNSKKKYRKEYIKCLFMIRWLLPKAIFGTEFSRQEKIGFIKRAINPIKYAKMLTSQQQEALKHDTLK